MNVYACVYAWYIYKERVINISEINDEYSILLKR